MFLALSAAGRVVSGAGLASFHPEMRVPPQTSQPRAQKAEWIRLYVLFLLRDPASSGAGAGGAGRAGLARPRLSVGCPPRCPPSLARVLLSGDGRRDLYIYFVFYLRRGAASGREGKVQAAGGRAPLSPMEGV